MLCVVNETDHTWWILVYIVIACSFMLVEAKQNYLHTVSRSIESRVIKPVIVKTNLENYTVQLICFDTVCFSKFNAD